MAENDPDRFAQWAAQTKRSPAMMMNLQRDANAQWVRVPDVLKAVAAQLRQRGVRLGSHDDDSAETRAFFRSIGVPIAEFPTTPQAARAGRVAHLSGELARRLHA
jgi:alpha-D-ribose 1-methylphosphonate 5-triphosphate diphosphatase